MPNLKLAVRTLAKTPFVSAVAVLSLALGIGANTAIFSLFDEVLLRPLPVAHPERLVNLSAPGWKPGAMECTLAGPCSSAIFSYPMFRDLERLHPGLSGVAGHYSFGVNVAYQGRTLHGDGLLVSGSYFSVLGLKPALGRLLDAGDDRAADADYVAVLSHEYWASQLGSDPTVLNHLIAVNGQPMTIVGVAPEGFEGTTLGLRPTVFVPIAMRGRMTPGSNSLADRQDSWVYVFARVASGVSVAQASVLVNAEYHRIINLVEVPLVQGANQKSIAAFRSKRIVLEDGRRGQSTVRQVERPQFTILLAITSVVLLIACVNIANLLLARGARRSGDMAVWLALGATRRHLMSQLLTESCMLALIGGAVSLAVAQWTLTFVPILLPAETVTGLHFSLSTQAVVFTSVLSIGTGILFGLFPAMQSTRQSLASTMRDVSARTSPGGAVARSRAVLVTAQIALSTALLILAGLFLRSLLNVSHVDLGMDQHNVVTFGISPQMNGYSSSRSATLFSRAEAELAALPGVVGVAASTVPILSDDNTETAVGVEGFVPGPDGNVGADLNEVSPGYFHVMGISLLAGRDFTLSDRLAAPKVAIVNEAFAKKFHLGREAVGKHMTGSTEALDVEIVGLARNAKYSDVKDSAPPQYFTPYAQDTSLGTINLYVRTATGAAKLLQAIPGVIKKLDPDLPVQDLKTLVQQAQENVFLDRTVSTFSAIFAGLATLLAAVGLYGAIAYSVAKRTREIGVRIALGSDPSRVRRMVLRQAGSLALIGTLIGIFLALAAGRFARSFLFGLGPDDPAVFCCAVLLVGVVALAAGYIPARRASKIDPMRALKSE